MASHTGNPGGRPKSRFLDWLRTRAWLAHLKKTLAAQTDNALKERLEKHGFTFPVSKYLAGVDFPKQTTRTLVGKLKPLERANLVYDIGPEVDGENVSLWRLFEEVTGEFDEIIDVELSRSGKPSRQEIASGWSGNCFLTPASGRPFACRMRSSSRQATLFSRQQPRGNSCPTCARWRQSSHAGGCACCPTMASRRWSTCCNACWLGRTSRCSMSTRSTRK